MRRDRTARKLLSSVGRDRTSAVGRRRLPGFDRSESLEQHLRRRVLVNPGHLLPDTADCRQGIVHIRRLDDLAELLDCDTQCRTRTGPIRLDGHRLNRGLDASPSRGEFVDYGEKLGVLLSESDQVLFHIDLSWLPRWSVSWTRVGDAGTRADPSGDGFDLSRGHRPDGFVALGGRATRRYAGQGPIPDITTARYTLAYDFACCRRRFSS